MHIGGVLSWAQHLAKLLVEPHNHSDENCYRAFQTLQTKTPVESFNFFTSPECESIDEALSQSLRNSSRSNWFWDPTQIEFLLLRISP